MYAQVLCRIDLVSTTFLKRILNHSLFEFRDRVRVAHTASVHLQSNFLELSFHGHILSGNESAVRPANQVLYFVCVQEATKLATNCRGVVQASYFPAVIAFVERCLGRLVRRRSMWKSCWPQRHKDAMIKTYRYL